MTTTNDKPALGVLATMNCKALAAATICQARKDVRYYLNGILIQPDPDGGCRAVATNGHIMLIVTDRKGYCEKDMIVDLAPQLVTKMKTQTAIDATFSTFRTEKEIICEIPALDHIEKVTLIDGKFVNWQTVAPDKLPRLENADEQIVVDPKYFSLMCDVAKVLDVSAMSTRAKDKNSPMCISFGTPRQYKQSLHVRGIVMPTRWDELDWLPPVIEEK